MVCAMIASFASYIPLPTFFLSHWDYCLYSIHLSFADAIWCTFVIARFFLIFSSKSHPSVSRNWSRCFAIKLGSGSFISNAFISSSLSFADLILFIIVEIIMLHHLSTRNFMSWKVLCTRRWFHELIFEFCNQLKILLLSR